MPRTFRRQPRIGDPVVYRKSKSSTRPGPRARAISPAERGDSYTYVVDKLWMVADVQDDGRLLLVTRRGKQHVVEPDDPQMRLAYWWERIRFRSRFPQPSQLHEAVSEGAAD